MAEHRVEFAERLDATRQLLRGQIERACDLGDLLVAVREELVKRWIEQPDGDRVALHRPENAREVLSLHRQDLVECIPTPRLVRSQDHAPHGEDPVLAEEHVLRPAESDALRAKTTCERRVFRCVRVRADAEPALRIGPSHHSVVFVGQHGVDERDSPEHDLPAGSIDRDQVAEFDGDDVAGRTRH